MIHLSRGIGTVGTTLRSRFRHIKYLSSGSLKVLFFGTDDVSVPLLSALVESLKGSGAHAGLVSQLGVVTLDRRALRHKQTAALPVAEVAIREGIKTWLVPSGQKSLKDWVPSAPLDHWDIGVVASFGFKLPDYILGTLDGGAINMHPSLLPRYRGAAPIPHALLNGDSTTGVTVMHVDPFIIDSGAILRQVEVPILESDTASR